MSAAQSFACVPHALLEAPDIAASEFAVLVALYSYADSEGKCWPSLASIARRAHLAKRSTVRVLSSLEKNGYLARLKRFEKGSRELTSTLYTLNIYRLGIGSDRLSLPRDAKTLPKVETHRPQVGTEVTR